MLGYVPLIMRWRLAERDLSGFGYVFPLRQRCSVARWLP